MNNQLNQIIQNIAIAKRSGQNPQQVMQMMLQSNPQYRQLLTQMQNMAQGRNPRDFIMQLARQNGVDEIGLQTIAQMLDNQ